MAKISFKVLLKVADTLQPRCKNVRSPITYERSHGDRMEMYDFEEQLRRPINAHRAKAEAFILYWLLTGKRKTCSGFTAFVVSEALHSISDGLRNAKEQTGDILPDTGVPYDEAVAKNITRIIVDHWFNNVMEGWVESEAKDAYQIWKGHFNEYYYGPGDH